MITLSTLGVSMSSLTPTDARVALLLKQPAWVVDWMRVNHTVEEFGRVDSVASLFAMLDAMECENIGGPIDCTF